MDKESSTERLRDDAPVATHMATADGRAGPSMEPAYRKSHWDTPWLIEALSPISI